LRLIFGVIAVGLGGETQFVAAGAGLGLALVTTGGIATDEAFGATFGEDCRMTGGGLLALGGETGSGAVSWSTTELVSPAV
jgi:hypothetical protein